jgi:hypothetical protein
MHRHLPAFPDIIFVREALICYLLQREPSPEQYTGLSVLCEHNISVRKRSRASNVCCFFSCVLHVEGNPALSLSIVEYLIEELQAAHDSVHALCCVHVDRRGCSAFAKSAIGVDYPKYLPLGLRCGVHDMQVAAELQHVVSGVRDFHLATKLSSMAAACIASSQDPEPCLQHPAKLSDDTLDMIRLDRITAGNA